MQNDMGATTPASTELSALRERFRDLSSRTAALASMVDSRVGEILGHTPPGEIPERAAGKVEQDSFLSAMNGCASNINGCLDRIEAEINRL